MRFINSNDIKLQENRCNQINRLESESNGKMGSKNQQNSQSNYTLNHHSRYQSDQESINMNIHHRQLRLCRVSKRKLDSKVMLAKGKFMSLATISLVVILYILANEPILTIMSAGRSFNNNDNLKMTIQYQRSVLIKSVNAEPAPQPSPASARTSSSASRRLPPINGSIFGKRSLNGLASRSSPSLNPQLEGNSRQQNELGQQKAQSKSESQNSISKATNYNDVITEIIEDFLALNNESDPEEASVAFCRMIVYECNQMLSARGKVSERRRIIRRNQIK